MKTEFNLLISFRTPDGFKVCGQYFLGNDREFAWSVFAGLTGREDLNDRAVLHLDLLEIVDGLPVKIKTISCRLTELCGNCEHIVRELFRFQAIGVSASPLKNPERYLPLTIKNERYRTLIAN